MTAATHETSSGAPDWVLEAVQLPCPHCGVQPPENCHDAAGEVTEFAGPGHSTIKMHAPRWRQASAYVAQLHGD